jgi:hypothetical protein
MAARTRRANARKSAVLLLSASVSYTEAVVMAVADEYETPKIFG